MKKCSRGPYVKTTGYERALAVYAGEQEVLVGANTDSTRPGWSSPRARENFCRCPVHLFFVLIGGG